MPTQQIEFEAPSGMTLTAKLYAIGSDTVAYTASSCVEQTNRKGYYIATFANLTAGTYQLVATVGSTAVAIWWGYAEDTNSIFQFGQSSGVLLNKAITPLSFTDGAITAAAIATDAIGNLELSASAVAEIADAIWDEALAAHNGAGTAGKYLNDMAVNGVTVLGFTVGAITSSAFAVDAINSSAVATSAAYKIGDGILTRDMFSVESVAPEHSLCTLVLAALEYDISGTTWTIRRTDGVTPHLIKTLTPDSTATFVVGVQ